MKPAKRKVKMSYQGDNFMSTKRSFMMRLWDGFHKIPSRKRTPIYQKLPRNHYPEYQFESIGRIRDGFYFGGLRNV